MNRVYLEATEKTGAALFSRQFTGPIIMLNMLRFRDLADYTEHPELDPGRPITGREAFQLYIEHTLPFLENTGGDIDFLGEGGGFFIGPEDEHWDLVMMVRQNSLADFLSFATNEGYLKGLGHRNAAIIDSRLLPLAQ